MRWHLASQLAGSVGLALLYLAGAQASRVFAVPPGYASMVWLPAGIALAAAMRFKPEVLVGVVLGSGLNNSMIGASPWAGLLIGIGAALQAWVGARFIGDCCLRTWRCIAKIVLLGGALGCLVNSHIGPRFLALFGAIEWANLPENSARWWLGDTLGVVLFAPISLLVIDRCRQTSPKPSSPSPSCSPQS